MTSPDDLTYGLISREFVELIAMGTELQLSTVLDLLNKGWVYHIPDITVSYWERVHRFVAPKKETRSEEFPRTGG